LSLNTILLGTLTTILITNQSTALAHNLDPNFDNPFQLRRDTESLVLGGQFQKAIALQKKYIEAGTEPCRKMVATLTTTDLPIPFASLPDAEELFQQSLKAKNLNEKIRLAKVCTKTYPNFEYGHLLLAKIYSVNMWDKKAEIECLKAHAIAPSNIMILRQLGIISIHRRKAKQARSVYEQIVKARPHDLDADCFFMEMNQPNGKISNLELFDRNEVKRIFLDELSI
jgi:tetratricopeptide (TPR) repeat protein